MLKLGEISELPFALNCSIHALQSCIEHAMKIQECENLMIKVKALIQAFNTQKGRQALSSAQKKLHAENASDSTERQPPTKFLITPGDTRWDSEFDSMYRLMEMLPIIDVALSTIAKGTKLVQLTLTDEDRSNLFSILGVLQHFRTLSQHLQDRSTCVSSVAAAFDSLRTRLMASVPSEAAFMRLFKQELLRQVNDRLTESYFAPCSIGSIAAVFREKYKALTHLSSVERSQTWEWIITALHDIDSERHVCNTVIPMSDNVMHGINSKSSSKRSRTTSQPSKDIDDFVDDILLHEESGSSKQQASCERSIEEEVAAYMKHISLPEDVKLPSLIWWSRFGSTYPRLLRLALRVLAVQPTSAESERSFSSSGLISTKRRASLHSRTLEYLSFHRYNEPVIKSNREARLAKRSKKGKTILPSNQSQATQFSGLPSGADSDWSTDDEES
jgi:hypothetical protein